MQNKIFLFLFLFSLDQGKTLNNIEFRHSDKKVANLWTNKRGEFVFDTADGTHWYGSCSSLRATEIVSSTSFFFVPLHGDFVKLISLERTEGSSFCAVATHFRPGIENLVHVSNRHPDCEYHKNCELTTFSRQQETETEKCAFEEISLQPIPKQFSRIDHTDTGIPDFKTSKGIYIHFRLKSQKFMYIMPFEVLKLF